MPEPDIDQIVIPPSMSLPYQPHILWCKGKIISVSQRLSFHMGWKDEYELLNDTKSIDNLLKAPSRTELEDWINEAPHSFLNLPENNNHLMVQGKEGSHITFISVILIKKCTREDIGDFKQSIEGKKKDFPSDADKKKADEIKIKWESDCDERINTLNNSSNVYYLSANADQCQLTDLIVKNAQLGCFVSNLEGKFLYANEYLAKLYGRELDALLDIKNIAQEIYVCDKDREKLISILHRKGKCNNFLFEVKTVEGKQIQIAKDCSVYKFNEQTVGFFGYVCPASSSYQVPMFEHLEDDFLSDPNISEASKVAFNKIVEKLNNKYEKVEFSLYEAGKISKTIIKLFGKETEVERMNKLSVALDVQIKSVEYARQLLVDAHNRTAVLKMLRTSSEALEELVNKQEVLEIPYNFDKFYPSQQFISSSGLYKPLDKLSEVLGALKERGISDFASLRWLSTPFRDVENKTPWELLREGKQGIIFTIIGNLSY